MARDDNVTAGVLAAVVIVLLLLGLAGAGSYLLVARRAEGARLAEVQARAEAELAHHRALELEALTEAAPPVPERETGGMHYQVEVTDEQLAVWDRDGGWMHLEKGSGQLPPRLVVGVVGKPPALGLAQLEIDLGNGEVLRLPRDGEALLRVVGPAGVVDVPGPAPANDVLVGLLDAGTSIERWLLEWTGVDSVDLLFELPGASR